MSKVKVVIVEYEGTEAPLAELLRAFVHGEAPAVDRQLAPPAAAPEPPRALVAPPQVDAAPVRQIAPVKRGRKAGPKPKHAAESPQPADGSTADQVRKLLQKGPMTSGDLIRASRCTAPAVYTVLSTMRKAGDIETREDPADAQRKNYLVG